jgi:hypothetical protein
MQASAFHFHSHLQPNKFKVSSIYIEGQTIPRSLINKISSYFLVRVTEAPSEIITVCRRMLMNPKGYIVNNTSSTFANFIFISLIKLVNHFSASSVSTNNLMDKIVNQPRVRKLHWNF